MRDVGEGLKGFFGFCGALRFFGVIDIMSYMRILVGQLV